MKVALLVLVSIIAFANCKNIRFMNCAPESKAGHVKALDVTPCDGNPCPLVRGKNGTITITFATGVVITKIKAVVKGKVGILPEVSFGIPNPDGCHGSGLVCPIKSGTVQEYVETIHIKSFYPSVSVVIHWELIDQDGDKIVCVKFPAKLT